MILLIRLISAFSAKIIILESYKVLKAIIASMISSISSLIAYRSIAIYEK